MAGTHPPGYMRAYRERRKKAGNPVEKPAIKGLADRLGGPPDEMRRLLTAWAGPGNVRAEIKNRDAAEHQRDARIKFAERFNPLVIDHD